MPHAEVAPGTPLSRRPCDRPLAREKACPRKIGLTKVGVGSPGSYPPLPLIKATSKSAEERARSYGDPGCKSLIESGQNPDCRGHQYDEGSQERHDSCRQLNPVVYRGYPFRRHL